jgi:hypothetical protein
MKNMFIVGLLTAALMCSAAFAQVTAIEIKSAGTDKFTGTVTGYEYVYAVSEMDVRVFANENGTNRKIQASINFQSNDNYTPDLTVIHNAFENPNKNFMIELSSPNNTNYNNSKILTVVAINKLRPIGSLTIKPL